MTWYIFYRRGRRDAAPLFLCGNFFYTIGVIINLILFREKFQAPAPATQKKYAYHRQGSGHLKAIKEGKQLETYLAAGYRARNIN
jgi:hypothetical protein